MRNEEIRAKRLSAEEVVAVESADEDRFGTLQRSCADGTLTVPSSRTQLRPPVPPRRGERLLAMGQRGNVPPLQLSLAPDTVYDLRTGTLREAWEEWVSHDRDLRGGPEFLEKWRKCDIINLCVWRPSHAAFETGGMDDWIEYFCDVACARKAANAATEVAATDVTAQDRRSQPRSLVPAGEPAQL